MKRFACGDVVPGCTATFTGDSDDTVLAEVGRHAREDHAMDHVPDDVVAAVRARIVTVDGS